MAESIPDIISLIPQRAPFVMVDELLSADETSARSRFRIAADNVLVSEGRFTPGGLLENIAQTVAAGAGYAAFLAGEPVVPGHIVSVSRLAVSALPAVGDELFTEITVLTRIPDIIVISGRVLCGVAEMAACEMKILTSV